MRTTPLINQTTLMRALTLRELQRNFGQNTFRYKNVRRIHEEIAGESPGIVNSLHAAGWLVREKKGCYRLSEEALRMLKHLKDRFS